MRERNSSAGAMRGPQLALLVLVLLAFTYTILLGLKSETADEGFHTPQIWSFYTGNYAVAKELTMLPVYHGIIAGMLKASQYFSVAYARFCHLLICALAVPLFYFSSRRMQSSRADMRTLLFVSSPLLLPFFSLIYTDIPALLFVLGMFLFYLRRQHWISAIFGLVAISMRQPNLIWLVFVGVLALSDYFSERSVVGLKDFKRGLWPLFLKLLPYVLVVAVAAAFLIINGSVAVGDAHQHDIGLNLSNLYFLLLLAFFLFLPYNLAYGTKIWTLLLKKPMWWIIIVVLFVLFMATYNNLHQYNSYGLKFYLRNVLLHFTVSFSFLKVMAFVPIAWMVLTLALFYSESENRRLLGIFYIFVCLSVLPLPLIEQRYYIVGIALFLLFKPRTDEGLDMATLYMYVPMNCVLLWGIARHMFFL